MDSVFCVVCTDYSTLGYHRTIHGSVTLPNLVHVCEIKYD